MGDRREHALVIHSRIALAAQRIMSRETPVGSRLSDDPPSLHIITPAPPALAARVSLERSAPPPDHDASGSRLRRCTPLAGVVTLTHTHRAAYAS